MQLLFPIWIWVLIIPCLLQILALDPPWSAFLKGGCSGGLLWLISSLFYWYTAADIIAGRMTLMLQLPQPAWLVIITVLIAFIAAGCAALSGALLRIAIARPT